MQKVREEQKSFYSSFFLLNKLHVCTMALPGCKVIWRAAKTIDPPPPLSPPSPSGSYSFLIYCRMELRWPEAEFKEKHGVWDPMRGVDYNITQCRLQSLLFTMGNPMPESTVTGCQSWLFPPSKGLRIRPRFGRSSDSSLIEAVLIQRIRERDENEQREKGRGGGSWFSLSWL
jgi:hypothetical protein